MRTCLFEWYTDSDGNRIWDEKKCTEDDIRPAPKDSRKPAVTARRACDSHADTGWANLVDVDVNGTWDSGEESQKVANVLCRVH